MASNNIYRHTLGRDVLRALTVQRELKVGKDVFTVRADEIGTNALMIMKGIPNQINDLFLVELNDGTDTFKIDKDGILTFYSDLQMNGNQIKNLGEPTEQDDAVTRQFVENLTGTTRQAVRVATTASGTLATSYEAGDTVDGVVLATGNRILIKNQGTTENGIYTVNASGAPSRATDFSVGNSVASAFFFVQEGTANADRGFVVSNNAGADVVGTHVINFNTFTSPLAGTGLTDTGGTFDVNVTQPQITGIGTSGVTTTFAGSVVINENLTVSGTTTSINSETLTIFDNLIKVNSGPSGTRDAGMLVERYQVANDAGTGDVVSDTAAVSDTAQTGGASTITLAVAQSAADDFYNNWWIKITNNDPVGIQNQVRKITDYVGATRVATVATAWTTVTPTVNTTFSLYNKPLIATFYNETTDRWIIGATASDSGSSPVTVTDNIAVQLGSLFIDDDLAVTGVTTLGVTNVEVTNANAFLVENGTGTDFFNINTTGSPQILASTNTAVQGNTAGIFKVNLTDTTNVLNIDTAGASLASSVMTLSATTASTSGTTGALVVSGGVGIGGNLNVDGVQIIDVTNTEALLVRKNADAGDVFAVDTTNSQVTVTGTAVIEGTQIIDINSSEAFLVRKNADAGDIFTINTTSSATTISGALTITGASPNPASVSTFGSTSSRENFLSSGTVTATADGLRGIQLQNTLNTGGFAQTNVSQLSVSAGTVGGTATITNLATLYIADALGAGTNTVTNGPYALYVAGGATRFNGNTRIFSTTNSTSVSTGALVSDGGLGVASDIYVGGEVLASNGSVSTASFGFINDPNTGMYLASDANLGFTINGTQRINVSATAFNASTLDATFDDITGTNIAGTLTTASQTNITAVGTLTSLVVSGTSELTGAVAIGTTPSAAFSLNIERALAGAGNLALFRIMANISPTTATSIALNQWNQNNTHAWGAVNASSSHDCNTLIQQQTITGSGTGTITNVATLLVQDAPTNSSTLTITNGPFALYVPLGANRLGGITTFSNSTASSSTTTGAVIVTGGVGIGGAVNIGGALDVNGATTLDQVTIDTTDGSFSVTGTNTVSINPAGALTLNSSAGTIGLGNDAVAQNINIGTGAAARTITVGNSTTTTKVDVVSGTGGVSINGGYFLQGTLTVTSSNEATVSTNNAVVYTLNHGSAGAVTSALANGKYAGQVINLRLGTITDGTTITISGTGFTSLVLDAVNDYFSLIWNGSGWLGIGGNLAGALAAFNA